MPCVAFRWKQSQLKARKACDETAGETRKETCSSIGSAYSKRRPRSAPACWSRRARSALARIRKSTGPTSEKRSRCSMRWRPTQASGSPRPARSRLSSANESSTAAELEGSSTW